MLNAKLEKALNKQINEEFYSSYLYLSMSAWFESKSLLGFANWMKLQSKEEYQHAEKFYNYVFTKGGTVTLAPIGQPKTEWKSVLDAFQNTLEHEQHITKCINDLVDLALAEKDHATGAFLQWFVNEQVEEEANATKILDDLKMIGDNSYGIFMLDREMGQRKPEAEPEAGKE
ncbi:MAG: ferritin [Ignavibacteriales bacterium]|nr:Bacterial non-heme ferritin [Ignavibacteriaceae bacterium]MCK6613652.1 ferritin [Ignavibacteriaceae bacterium]QOJ27454.1 MAG: ferritin [Ignavibacteriales bacterium]